MAQRDVELSDEVVRWYARLGDRDRAFADRALDRLASTAPQLRMPQSRALGGGLHELRFSCEGVSRRITYALGAGREVTALTTFRKERGRERHEVDRAHRVLARMRSAGRDMERSR
ncbi:MAG TPA: type II toxin-antitoxin system RelE/ParE family toxin [Acidimicrobiales bacterium]|nr:type II toxin-antitoxin system RelE/ParE family toxin [Acidimicrobiales bacterium]